MWVVVDGELEHLRSDSCDGAKVLAVLEVMLHDLSGQLISLHADMSAGRDSQKL